MPKKVVKPGARLDIRLVIRFENGPLSTSQNTTKNIPMAAKPALSIERIKSRRGSGAKAYSNLEPSSGGHGTILNKKKAKFISTVIPLTS